MDERYLRNLPALSEKECAILREKHVAVIGCGGLGGFIIELLARVGVGHIKCVDGDVFEKSNLNRQLLSNMSVLGSIKAQAAVERVAVVNPDVKAAAVCEFLTEKNAAAIIEGYDAVFDALDNIDARRTLAKACAEVEVPYIYGAVGGWVAQAAVSMPGDGLVEMLYPEGTEVKNKSVLSFTPAFCAAMQASLGVKLLAGRKVETGKIYYFDLLNQEFETIAMI
ncbi:MAG: HesA/MoeB/ThiF family protein [Oscillospiraceae bacterium]|nr:HesA/MoeB/ThiF family protein [Oscillospiraceae bacterium]